MRTCYELMLDDNEPKKIVLLKEWGNGDNHFTAIEKLTPDISYYYDSFGLPPPEPFLHLNKKVLFNTTKDQSDEENNCGARSILNLQSFS